MPRQQHKYSNPIADTPTNKKNDRLLLLGTLSLAAGICALFSYSIYFA